MRKTSKKIIFYSMLILFVGFGIYSILSYYNFFQDTLTIINNTVYSRQLPSNTFKSTYTPKIKFEDMPVTKVPDITLNILDKATIKNPPTLLKAQRYYIPLNLICSKLNYTLEKSDDNITIKNEDHKIILNEDSYEKDSMEGTLRGNLILNNNEYYISISDIENIFDLIAVFNFENNTINLLPCNANNSQPSTVKITKKLL